MEQSIQATVQSTTTGRRFVNFVIDEVLYLILMLFFVNPIAIAILGDALTSNFLVNFLFNSFFLFLYYFVFESAFQRTPGKLITGTKVIMEDGSKPDIVTIAKRSLTRAVPFEVISIYTGNESEKKGTWWHDRWTSTRVVKI